MKGCWRCFGVSLKLMCFMNFIQGRCQILPENLNFIVGLISTLNSCSRRAFSKSIRANITTKEVTDVWALRHGVYINQVDVHKQHEFKLTSSQKSMIARHAKNLRVTANARAKYLSTHYFELASACEGAIIKNKQQLVKIKAEIVAGSNNAFLRPEALKKKTQQITKLRFLIHQMSNRLQRLKAAAEKSSQLSERGLATMCLGGKKTGLCCA